MELETELKRKKGSALRKRKGTSSTVSNISPPAFPRLQDESPSSGNRERYGDRIASMEATIASLVAALNSRMVHLPMGSLPVTPVVQVAPDNMEGEDQEGEGYSDNDGEGTPAAQLIPANVMNQLN